MRRAKLISAGTGNEPDMDPSANRIVLLMSTNLDPDPNAPGDLVEIFVEPFGPPLPVYGDLIEWEEEGGHHAYWTRPGDTFRITLRKRGYEIDPQDHTRGEFQ